MISNIYAGILMGFLAGASAKGHTAGVQTGISYYGFAMFAAASAMGFVVYTFSSYSPVYELAAVAELIVGALIAGLLTPTGRKIATCASPVGLVFAWIMAAA